MRSSNTAGLRICLFLLMTSAAGDSLVIAGFAEIIEVAPKINMT